MRKFKDTTSFSEIWPHTLHCTDEIHKVERVALYAVVLLPIVISISDRVAKC